MTVFQILLVIAAFCVAFWVTIHYAKPPFQTPFIVTIAILLILFLLYQAGALGFLNMKVGR